MEDDTKRAPEPPTSRASELSTWRPFQSLRREVDRLFEDFDRGIGIAPFFRGFSSIGPFATGRTLAPAVNLVEKPDLYEITVDLPGLDENAIEVRLSDGGLLIKGQKADETEEKGKQYYLHERHFGSFERYLQLPRGVDADRIEATFKKGVLTVTLPKTAEAAKADKTIPIKAA
jgi:HSP20 family protein